jgi:hypothetical protein
MIIFGAFPDFQLLFQGCETSKQWGRYSKRSQKPRTRRKEMKERRRLFKRIEKASGLV